MVPAMGHCDGGAGLVKMDSSRRLITGSCKGRLPTISSRLGQLAPIPQRRQEEFQLRGRYVRTRKYFVTKASVIPAQRRILIALNSRPIEYG
jgi:hypothetical protein